VAKILVADDNSNIQKMVGLALKDQGIDVVAVGNGEAAVRKISDIRPDLVLADVFMPVRNGYEVCNYVKQDAALAHIPVILLVGAFDPLDEQEAQRVGADGVLKKPFVPPDPLISMVKSALTRAGVVLGAPEPTATAAAPPPPPLPRVAPPPPPPIPAVAEPEFSLPTFSSRPAPISINKGEQPLAFGSLLDTPSAQEEEPIFTAPGSSAPERDWGHHEEQEEEVEEETTKTGSWRLSTLDESPNEVPAGQKDWREAAFAGIGTANGDKAFKEWAPSVEKNSLSISEQEAADLAKKQELLGAPVVTGAEDWSKAISDIFPEKPLAAPPAPPSAPPYHAPAASTEHAPSPIVEPVRTPSVPEPVLAASAQISAPEPGPALDSSALNSPALNSWMAGAVSPWESELQRANDLASSWDPAKLTPAALVEDADATQPFLAPSLLATAHGHVVETIEEVKAEEFHTVAPEVSSYIPAPVETLHSPAEHQVEEEVAACAPVAHEEPAVAHEAVEHAAIESPAETEEPTSAYVAEPAAAAEPVVFPAVEPDAKPASSANTNMDELVAKVLAKMNPDALQAVTREILRPVIEALVKEELSKK
jgi:CheY-like chemotaxis protein